MARLAEEISGQPLAFEVSLENVDKPSLDLPQIQRRVTYLEGHPVWITRAATFGEKASIFPGATFAVGADTLARIAEPKYYEDQTAMERAIDKIVSARCRFLVYCRVEGDSLVTLGTLALPESLMAICREVPPARFRSTLSSTELRSS